MECPECGGFGHKQVEVDGEWRSVPSLCEKCGGEGSLCDICGERSTDLVNGTMCYCLECGNK